MAWSNSTPPSRHPTRFWGRQFRALLTKHFLTSLRSPVFPVIVLLLPAVISAALIIIFYAVGPPALDRAAGNSNAPSSSLIQPFKITLKCSEPRSIGEPSQCPMVYYAPNDAYHTAIMTRMATMTGLRMNDHIRGFDSHDAMAAAFIDTIETVQLTSSYFAGVAWTTLPAAASSLFPNVTAYNVWEAKPLERGGRGMFTYDNLVRNLQGSTWGGSGTLESIKTQHIGLQIAIESATTSVLTEKVTGKGAGTNLMEVNWNWLNPAEVPNNDEVYLVDRQQSSKEYLLSSFNGGLGAVMPMFPLPLFAYTLHSISSEKQAGLLGPIKRMGLYESAYWMAALVIPMIMNIFGALSSALILTIGGGKNGVQWPVLSSIDLPTMLLLQFSHGCAFIGTAMFWSSMVSRTILVGLLVTIYAAFHLVLPMFLFGSFNWLLSLGSTAVHVLTTFLVPAITFGKVWFEISNTVLPSALNSNNATNFTIATAFNNSRGPIANTSIYAKPEELVKIIQTWTTLPTSGFSMITFIVSLTVAMWFAWYVDQVLPGSQEGFRRPFYFPFTMAYWTGRTVRRSKGGSEKSDKEAEVQVRSEKLGSVEVLGLTKVFGLGKKKHTAVDGIQFTLEKGSCSALLGVNGAGKSTTINMLTGMSNPTSGCAYIFGLDVRSEISAIQSMMGVCAQFDFLYPYLTAAEHVHFYARFRGVDPVEEGFANLQDYTMHKLRKVNLEDVHNKPVGGFSGGMKRRMSFTLATVGPNLKFILLDEVTTGLDPLSRRKCWKVVEELKRDKIVLLTTHSMEEAEALGDHVCIMQNGKVRASGSQIFLKSRFGAGYLLDFLAKEGIVDQFNIPQKTVEYEPESQPKRGKWFNFSKKPEDDIELQNQDQNDEPADGTAELLREWVSQSLHNFQVVSTAGRTLTIGVPRTSVNDLAQFFHSLDNQSDNSVEWAVSTTTLEEVFLKISADKAGVAGAGDIEDPFAPAPPSPASTNERSICSVCYREASELFGSGSSTSPVSQMMCSHCVTSQRAGSMIRGDRSFAPQSNRAAMSFAEFCRRRVGFASARNQPYPSHSAVHGQLIPDRTSNARRSRQVRAIFLKNLLLHAKQWIVNILMLLLIGVLYYLTINYNRAMTDWQSSQDQPGIDKNGPPLGDKCKNVFLGIPNTRTGTPNRDYDGALGTCDPKFLTSFMLQPALAPANLTATTYLGACTATNVAACFPNTFSTFASPGTVISVLTSAQENYARSIVNDAYSSGPSRAANTSFEFIGRLSNTAVPRFRLWYTDPSSGPRFDQFADARLSLFDESTKFDSSNQSFVGNGATYNERYRPSEGASDPFGPISVYPPLYLKVGETSSGDVGTIFRNKQVQSQTNRSPLPAQCRLQYGEGRTAGFGSANFAEVAAKIRDSYPTYGISFRSLPSKDNSLAPSFDFHVYPWDASPTAKAPFTKFYLTSEPENGVGQAFLSGPPFLTSYDYNSGGSGNSAGLPVKCLAFMKEISYDLRDANGAVQVMVNSMTNQWLRTVAAGNGTAPIIRGQSYLLPTFYTNGFRSFSIWSLSVFLLTLAASLMLPRLVDLLVQEKDKGQYEMIRIQGGKLTAYWISQYLYSLAMSSFFCILTILVAFVFKVQPYSDVGLLQSLGIMLVWAHCQVGLVFLISGLFKRPIASGIFSSIVVVASGLVSTLPVEGTGNLPSGAIPTAYALFPPFGIISVVNTLYAAGDNRAQVTLFVTSQIIFTFIVGTAYGLLGMYIHAVRPTSTGFGVDPLLGLGRLINKRSKQRNLEAVDQEPAFDGDVQEEENAVLDSWRDGNHSDKALTIIHLRKVFSKDKVAVRDLTLRMSPGDAFGLLGPNGAGKSTTLGMITGLVKPTRGEVYYGGNRLEDLIARGELARYVGFCPQQDIVWPDMTVEEHLRFFAQMRGGAPATQTVRDYVKGIAATVGLDDALKKRASQLSGGMKRRLCIGIALTGDPAVVVLDEPTSGLDPSNRRHIWQVIETIKSSRTVTNQKRSVLITTHSMVEADTLCSKIAIVTEGKVQAFGSQMRLKARYGDGLKLAVQFMVQVPLPRRAFDILRSSPSADDLKLFEDHDLIEYLKEVERARTDSVIKMARGIIAPGAYLDVPPSTDFTAVLLHFQNKFIASVQNASTTITWKVNAICGFPKGTAMSTVFTGLGPLCQSANILNWELNPTTLEDVFVKVVENNS